MKCISLATLLIAASIAGSANAHDHSAHMKEMQKEQKTSGKSAEANLPGKSLFNSESQWLRPNGDSTDLKALAGAPTLVAMLYTSCPTACPMTIGDMKFVAKQLTDAERKKLKMAMLSIDSEKDTPKALQAFSKKMNLDDKWTLLSPKAAADANDAASMLEVSFKKLPDGNYVHSNVIFLLNKSGEIVARKEGLNTDSKEFVAKIKAELAAQ